MISWDWFGIEMLGFIIGGVAFLLIFVYKAAGRL